MTYNPLTEETRRRQLRARTIYVLAVSAMATPLAVLARIGLAAALRSCL